MTAGEAAKVKLLCSFGGKILPRPGDSALRYIGGHTRIVTLRRDVSFHDLMLKMSDVLSSPSSSPVVLKYQLPDEDLDSLVTVSCPDDLDNMLEEYDKLLDSSPDGSAKLRVFLFDSPTSPRDHPTPLPLSDPTHRYIHALNMVPDPPTSTLPRKDSGCSTQNSDPPETTASPETFDAPAVTSPPAPSTTDFVPVNPPPVHAPPQEQFGGGYVGYIPNSSQLHYIGSQQYGYVTVATAPPPGSYMPGAQTATKAGLVAAGDVAGGKTLQPLSQLPPLPPFTNLQSVNVDRYGGGGWQQVQLPAHVPQGQGLRMDDCSFCQKVLPHAHSDSLVQVSGSGGAVPVGNLVEEMNPVYHSLRPEDFAGYCAQQHKVVVSVGVPDSVGEQRVEVSASGSSPAVAVAPTVGVYDYSPQILKMPNENERIAMNKAENTNLNPSAFSAGIAGFPVSLDTLYTQATLPGHIRTPIIGDYQLHPQNSPYLSTAQRPLTQDLLMHKVGAVDSNPAKVEKLYAMEPQQPHLHAMQDLLTSKVTAVDSNPAKIDMAHTLDPSFREGGAESLSSHARPVEGMMETLRVSSEMPAMHEQCKTNVRSATSTPRAMNSESPIIVMESRDNTDPVETRELLGNAFISNVILPEASSMKLAEQLPMSTLDMVYMSSVQPTGQPPIPHKRLLGGSNANRLHGGDRRELTSAIPLGNILPDVSTAPSSNSLLPLANASKPNETNIGEVRNPVPRDSLFSDPDPWGIKQVVQGVQATKPVRVASVESLSSRDSGTESHPSPTSESGHATIADKGNTHMVPLDPNRDPLLDLIPPMKESTSTQIKQGLQIATESLAAPVLQPSAPPAPVVPVVLATSGLPINEPGQETYGIQSVHNVVDTQNTFAHDRGHEDGKPKQSDKPNHGFQIAEDIERLQIIKNCDLEELRELGSGTFGTVYHGKWRGTDVAIKRISDRCFAGKPSDQERMRNDFWNEACNLADLHHPNVVAFYGVVRDGPGGSVATVTEFMVNGSLRNALQRNDKTLDMRKRLLIAMDVAFGMEYLHGKKIVHFDLKSDNLLVNLRDPHRPICKVGDLGLSKVKCQTLISGGVRGTLPWMAPELLSGDSNLVSEKVDVFSFGIVMWELLTGEEPYADLHYGAIIGGIVSNTLRPPIPESCDPEWRSLMEKCWSSEPLERPSFTEVAARLRVVAASYPRKVQPHPNPSTSSPMQK